MTLTILHTKDARLNIEYMHFDKFNLPPSGEQFSEQRDNWATPYKFNDYEGESFNKAFDEHTARSAELDQETGLYYYGARYYTPEIGIWLSVDPMSDKYPSLSPYAYCANNPVILVDPDGREIDGWELNFRTGELAWKNNSGGDNRQKVDVVDKGKNIFSFDLNTNKEQMNDYQNASQNSDFSLVGIGTYAEASASYGYGFAASVGEFSMFSEPDKTFQFADAGSYHGYDAGVGAGAMLIFGPKDMKGQDLQGWSISATGGAFGGEAGFHTSASRDGSPTWNYAVLTVGLSASINGGGISFSHTNVKEMPKKSGSGYWDRPNSHCFASGTKIYTLNGYSDIKDLSVGDTLYAFNFIRNKVEFSTVAKKHIIVSKYIFELKIGNETILVTEDHPFYVKEKGWVKVKDLIIGDVLFLENKSYENVISKRIIPWNDKVYNIEVGTHHNYFITGLRILVHNK